MPNSSLAQDHNFAVIESAVKETERGRAFLADYAKKVRHSDTLTMLALIRRLERWCEDQDIRLAQYEGRYPIIGNRTPEIHAAAEVDARAASNEQMTWGASLPSGHSDVLTTRVNLQNPAAVAEAVDNAGDSRVDVPQPGEGLDRVEHLADALRDFDRRLADLMNRHGVMGPMKAEGQSEPKGQSEPISSVNDGRGATTPRSVALDAMSRRSNTAGKLELVEEDILHDIAKALGTTA